MTKEHNIGTITDIKTIIQEINAKELISGYMHDLDEKKAFCELIDNAIDETTKGKCTEIIITLDSRDSRIIFENRNTPGMDDERLQDYCKFFGKSNDPNKIREHHIGGKMAALSFLSPEKSSLIINSGIEGTNKTNNLIINNWWDQLIDKKHLTQETYVGEYVKNGFTRFILEGVKEVPTNPAEIADHLGIVYGKLIEENKIDISLLSIKKGGKPIILEVLPTTIPFKEDSYNEKVVSLREEGGPKVSVRWGNIDQDIRRQKENNKRLIYDLKKPDNIRGDNLYIYYHGRHLSITPLSSLKIPGYTNKFVFQTFIIEADIIEGWISKKVYKDGLSLASQDTKNLLNKIVKIVEKDVAELAKDPDHDLEMQRYQNKTRVANPILASVLNKVFDNDLNAIALTFGLTTNNEQTNVKIKSDIKNESSIKTNRAPSLPGSGISHKTRPENTRRGYINPIPEFSIASFGETSPEAVFYIHSDSTHTLIDLNTDNPYIKHLLQQRGKVLLTGLLLVGAKALYHEKWINKAKNTHEYYSGLDRDIANFLQIASEIS